jgi:hypothetical protein
LGRTAETFHLFRPQQALGGVRLPDRLLSRLARVTHADPRTANAIAKNPISASASHRTIIGRVPDRAIPLVGRFN